MPKRVIDGEAMWRSDKIASMAHAWMKAEFAWLLANALANGSFECNPRLLWSKCYAYARPETTPEQVAQVLDELERLKLLFRWVEGGKTWGFWVGINKVGRLPSESRLRNGHEMLGAVPPADQLAAFMGQEASGQPVVSQRSTNGPLGLGSGLGSGLYISRPNPDGLDGTVDDSLADTDAGEQKREYMAAVGEVFTYYLEQTGRTAKLYSLTSLRRQKGLARLRECLARTGGDLEKAKALMMCCVDQLCASDWHMGRDPKTSGARYIEWEKHLFSDVQKLEWWWDRARGQQ